MMKWIFQLVAFASGIAMGITSIAIFILGLWIADQKYFDLLDTGVFDLKFRAGSQEIPVPLILIMLATAGSVFAALSVMVVSRNNPFISTPSST